MKKFLIEIISSILLTTFNCYIFYDTIEYLNFCYVLLESKVKSIFQNKNFAT